MGPLILFMGLLIACWKTNLSKLYPIHRDDTYTYAFVRTSRVTKPGNSLPGEVGYS